MGLDIFPPRPVPRARDQGSDLEKIFSKQDIGGKIHTQQVAHLRSHLLDLMTTVAKGPGSAAVNFEVRLQS